jgi:surface polysaccharide O-acyltransferase-like enzyme
MFFVSFENFFSKLGEVFREKISYIASTILGVFLIHPYVIHLIEDNTIFKPGSIYSPLWGYIILSSLSAFVLSFILVLLGKKIPILKLLFG